MVAVDTQAARPECPKARDAHNASLSARPVSNGRNALTTTAAATNARCAAMTRRPRRQLLRSIRLDIGARGPSGVVHAPDQPTMPEIRLIRIKKAGVHPGTTEWSRGPEHRETLVRVQNVRLYIVDDFGAIAEFAHRPGEAHPVEELVLACRLDLGGRQVAPPAEPAVAELLDPGAIGADVGIEAMIIL